MIVEPPPKKTERKSCAEPNCAVDNRDIQGHTVGWSIPGRLLPTVDGGQGYRVAAAGVTSCHRIKMKKAKSPDKRMKTSVSI